MQSSPRKNGVTHEPATVRPTGHCAGLGSLKSGVIADVVLWDGDPLELMSSPDAVYIAGVSTPMVSRQTKLRGRYMNLDERGPQAYERE